MRASDYIASFLHQQGVSHVFEMSGGMITYLLDSCYRAGAPKLVSVHHEQAAAFAAEAYARMTGVPGVAMATSGPGATNLLTGIGSCYFDSIPAVFITGQVNRHEQKGSRPVRQLGFQETDIVAMAAPVTKAAWQIQTPEQLPQLIQKAFHIALSDRPGPVLLDVPMDIQRADVSDVPVQVGVSYPPAKSDSMDFIYQMLDSLTNAQRPLVLAGGGIRSAQAIEPFRQLVRQLGIPVIHSLMAVDVLPYADTLRLGMLGSYGNRWVNQAVGNSDFLLILGSRLDIRQTGNDTIAFKGQRTIYHVDCEPGEMNNRVKGCQTHVAHLHSFLNLAVQLIADHKLPDWNTWLNEAQRLRGQWSDVDELGDVSGINPNVFMHELSRFSDSAAAFTIDVGQHQMWAAQSLELGCNQRFLTSGGMGAMGFALPSGVGAAIASPQRPVVVIAGDGGFQTNIHELQTVVRNQLPIKIVVLNNRCHGMVRQFQQSYFENRYQSTLWGYDAPDFERVAQAYGIQAGSVSEPENVEKMLKWLWQEPQQPALLQVMINTHVNVYPKIAFGKPMTEMEPLHKPSDIEGT